MSEAEEKAGGFTGSMKQLAATLAVGIALGGGGSTALGSGKLEGQFADFKRDLRSEIKEANTLMRGEVRDLRTQLRAATGSRWTRPDHDRYAAEQDKRDERQDQRSDRLEERTRRLESLLDARRAEKGR